MGDHTAGLDEEAVDQLLQFLRATEGEYTVTIPSRIGALPFIRPTEWGEWKVKSIMGPVGETETSTIPDHEVREVLQNARAVKVLHTVDTPQSVWGSGPDDEPTDAVSPLQMARKNLQEARDSAGDERFEDLIEHARGLLYQATLLYIRDARDEYPPEPEHGDGS